MKDVTNSIAPARVVMGVFELVNKSSLRKGYRSLGRFAIYDAITI